jgi:cell division protein FtsL
MEAARINVARPAPNRKPRPRPRKSASRAGSRASASRSRQRQAHRPPAARVVKPAMAGAALLPQAAVRSVGAVRDISDSGLIVRLTRGRGWIAVLCALLGGIVALNVLSLSLNAGSGRLSLQIDELNAEVSALRAEIDERLSASRVEQAATNLGMAVPDPEAITYLSAKDGDAQRLAHLLATDGFLLAPSQPSSYPSDGETYAPVPVTSDPPTTTVAPSTTTQTPTATTPTSTTGTTTTGTSSGTSGFSGSSGSSSSSTGGVGL